MLRGRVWIVSEANVAERLALCLLYPLKADIPRQTNQYQLYATSEVSMAYTPMAAGLLRIPDERIPVPDATMTVVESIWNRTRLTVVLSELIAHLFG